jgi:hypothetical protein
MHNPSATARPVQNAARPAPRRGGDQPHPGAVMPLMPAERAVRRVGAAVTNQHRRPDADGAYAARLGRVGTPTRPRRSPVSQKKKPTPCGLGFKLG